MAKIGTLKFEMLDDEALYGSNFKPIHEEKFTNPHQAERHLRIDLIDPDKLVQANDLKEVTNPVAFIRKGVPTPDGLWSNEIFGITQYQRANTFAYIDLHEEFINPLIYKLWCKTDSEIKNCVHGIREYKMSSSGQLEVVEDGGDNGISFIKKNIKNYRFRRTDSNKRDMNIDFIQKYIGRPEFFISKYIVIPAYYRDINTDQGRVTIDQINELYRSLIIAVKSLKESSDYGLTLSAATRGRIQELLVQIYDWFGSGTVVGREEVSGQIPGKFGTMRRAVKSKTTDYASRLVITAPQLKVERTDDIEADLDYCVVPLASICANFYPFIIFHARRILENQFSADGSISYIDKKGNIQYLHAKDYQTEFSDERIRKEIERFLTGFSNRFIRIEVPTVEGPVGYLGFKGYNITEEEYAKNPNSAPLLERDFTWCDLFYLAAVEAVKDKCVLITR